MCDKTYINREEKDRWLNAFNEYSTLMGITLEEIYNDDALYMEAHDYATAKIQSYWIFEKEANEH